MFRPAMQIALNCSCCAFLLFSGLSACGSSSHAAPPDASQPPAGLPVSLSDGRTVAAPQVVCLDGSYSISPLLTVGDRVPLLTGRWDELAWDQTHTYAVAGKLDGMGFAPVQDGFALWVNHEIAEDKVSQFSPDVSGSFTGARVSIFRFDDQWRCLGGRNLITSYSDSNGPYCSGRYSEGSFTQTWLNPEAAEGKYCSATLFSAYGGQPLFFPGEESGHGRAKVVYPDGRAVVLADSPVGSWENVVPLAASAAQDKSVILLLDDVQRAYLFMYVGTRSATDPHGLLNGETYVGALFHDGAFMPTSYGLAPGASAELRWTAVPREFYCGHATEIDKRKELFTLSRDWCAEAGTMRATRFIRIEDGDEDPAEPGCLYFTTTGDDKGEVEGDTNPDTYGSLWKLRLSNPGDPLAAASVTLVADGGPGAQISLDNLELYGRTLFVQEDVTAGRPEQAMAADGRSNSCWSLSLDTLQWSRPFAVNQFSAGQPLLPGSGQAVWETTGVTALPESFASQGRPGLLLNVQAHGINTEEQLGGAYIEGGQLLLALPLQW
ncbi:hypothetical protein IT575_03610 [bacterium]|nr:hypothetical protein [bacterium]